MNVLHRLRFVLLVIVARLAFVKNAILKNRYKSVKIKSLYIIENK